MGRRQENRGQETREKSRGKEDVEGQHRLRGLIDLVQVPVSRRLAV